MQHTCFMSNNAIIEERQGHLSFWIPAMSFNREPGQKWTLLNRHLCFNTSPPAPDLLKALWESWVIRGERGHKPHQPIVVTTLHLNDPGRSSTCQVPQLSRVGLSPHGSRRRRLSLPQQLIDTNHGAALYQHDERHLESKEACSRETCS